MKTWETLKSDEDRSVNFVAAYRDGGKIECRYVSRSDEYFIAYLSSHRGCQHSCRFCHLTATGQTDFTPVTLDEYLEQARIVIDYHKGLGSPCRKVNFNWMSRGEALSNPVIQDRAHNLIDGLDELAEEAGLLAEYNISTIIPRETTSLMETFGELPVNLYYSMYSTDPAFRKKWLPKAKPYRESLDLLSEWAGKEGREVIFHWALIKGENDSEEEMAKCLEEITSRNMAFRFNLVRYNPYSEKQGEESSDEVYRARFQQILAAGANPKSKIVPRVGFDVKASCGMFVK